MKQKEHIERHIATHTVHSAEDRSAVSFLESVLNPGGRICTSFSSDDKWPIMMDFLNMYLIQIYLKVLNKISLCKLKELTILAKRMEWYPIA